MAPTKKASDEKAVSVAPAPAAYDPADEKTAPVAYDPEHFQVKPEDVDTAGKTEQQVRDELMGVQPSDQPETRTEPVDNTPPAAAYVVEPNKSVTMADVAAINGIGIAPDASRVVTADEKDVFISEGMRNDLEINGWAIDPATGRKVVREA